MTYLVNRLMSRLQAEEGQGLVEYALIIVLIAIAVMATLTVLGTSVNTTLSQIASGLG